MAFVAEDGTGKENANSYISVAQADEYFQLRNNAAWSALTEQVKQSSLVQATDYIEARWGDKFAGSKLTKTQALLFPRVGSTKTQGVPANLIKATCEYAVRASKEPLAPDLQFDSSNRVVNSKTTKVGPIETKVEYSKTVGQQTNYSQYRDYPQADMYIKTLLMYSSGTVRN